jgi:hypothetical protein
VGSIALGLDWSGKSMNYFVGWDFFPVGGLKLNSKSVAKCFFLTSAITHKIPDKNSLFSCSSVPRNKNEISWEFLSNFFDKIFDDEYFVEFSIDFKYSRTKAH